MEHPFSKYQSKQDIIKIDYRKDNMTKLKDKNITPYCRSAEKSDDAIEKQITKMKEYAAQNNLTIIEPSINEINNAPEEEQD